MGGQFVAHPGGGATTYVVRFADHPLTADLEPLTLTSEQYYVLVDPAIEVLATTEVIAPEEPWLAGVEMPVAWARSWGAGRVAYVSVGHGLDELRLPQVTHLLHRAARWAARRQAD